MTTGTTLTPPALAVPADGAEPTYIVGTIERRRVESPVIVWHDYDDHLTLTEAQEVLRCHATNWRGMGMSVWLDAMCVVAVGPEMGAVGWIWPTNGDPAQRLLTEALGAFNEGVG